MLTTRIAAALAVVLLAAGCASARHGDPAARDVVLGDTTVDPSIGTILAEFTVTNHTSQSWDYFITVTVYDHRDPLGTALGEAIDLAPNTSKGATAVGGMDPGKNPATWTSAKVTKVERLEADASVTP